MRGSCVFCCSSCISFNPASHIKGKITITGARDDAAARQADERNKGVAFKNCAPFINCISEISNIQIDNCKDIDIIMAMYNLIEYSDNYAKTSGRLWEYYRDEPNDNLADSESFKSKIKITGKTPNNSNEKDSTAAGTFKIIDTKLYVPVVTLST